MYLRRIFLLILVFPILAAVYSCDVTDFDTASRTIIIDTDTGADDAAAILLAAVTPEINILGVTVAAGNVSLDQAVDNALMTLEVGGRSDVPVYAGADKPLNGEERETYSVWGTDGMGDADLIHPQKTRETASAVEFLLETVRQNPGKVEIVALGPMTNIAMAIREDPETMQQVRNIWSMGTAGFGPGNATPVAEFNVYKDAEAYQVVVDSGIPMTIIGLDMDNEPTWVDEADLARMRRSGPRTAFLADASAKLLEYKKTAIGQAIVDYPDAVAMAAMVWNDFMTDSVRCEARCVTDIGDAYGQVIFYKEGSTYEGVVQLDNVSAEVVTEVKSDLFVDRLIHVLGE